MYIRDTERLFAFCSFAPSYGEYSPQGNITTFGTDYWRITSGGGGHGGGGGGVVCTPGGTHLLCAAVDLGLLLVLLSQDLASPFSLSRLNR